MMMMGKHDRPAYRRTSSMTGITVNLGGYNINNSMDTTAPPPPPPPENQTRMMIGGEYEHIMLLSPRYNVVNSSYVVETAEFLRSCALCNRRLAPGRDIYMYRGDAAFCSLECREQQIKQDERNESREAAPAKKRDNLRGEVVAAAPKAAGKSGTKAAA